MESCDFPQRITLELTNHCNYRCAMCPSRLEADHPRGYIEPLLFTRLVDEAAEHLPVTLVPFFRGESLLHPQAVELIAYAKHKGLGPIQMATNGALLDGSKARSLLDAGIDFLSFSLDSIDPKEYSQVRPGGDLELVESNLFRLLDMKERGGYDTEIQVSATRTNLNSKGINGFIEYWRDRVDRVRIYYEHSADGNLGSLDRSVVKGEMARQACPKPFQELVVYYEGGVALCNHDWFRKKPLGSAVLSSLAQIWKSRAYESIRGQHLQPDDMTDEVCLGCDHWRVPYMEPPFIGELHTQTKGAIYAQSA